MERQSFAEAVAAFLAYASNDYHVQWKGHNASFEVVVEKAGRRYTRVIHQERDANGKACHRGSHSFIVMEDYLTPQGLSLKQGDVLKCASWKAPAMNFVRCNVFNQASFKGHVQWTGVS